VIGYFVVSDFVSALACGIGVNAFVLYMLAHIPRVFKNLRAALFLGQLPPIPGNDSKEKAH
jgi:hypothetical protein